MNRLLLLSLASLSLLFLFPGNCRGDERADHFEKHVRPLLVARCINCHGSKKQEGEIRLDSRAQILEGTEEVDALVQPGNPEASRLWQVLQYAADDVQMPPKSKLSTTELRHIQAWITAGAYWPRNSDFGKQDAVNRAAWKDHWAFQPLIADPPPDGNAQHPVDRFIRARLSHALIDHSPAADNRTLVRRLAFAVTGLPPQPEDLQAADALEPDQRSEWFEDFIAELLASPHFGERWGRYWLDVARYADTRGYVFTQDREYKDAWRYREWVIRALNDDMPYDEFLTRQLAADRFPESQDSASLAAMGYLTLGRRFLNNQHDIIDDRIDVVTRGMMGLTVACARCHDHKYDPIPTADYYSLYGIFASSDEPGNEPSPLRLVDRTRPVEPFIFVRGNAGNRGDRVPRQFLAALSSDRTPFSDGSGRLELARAISSDQNPLTPRVAVNRIWMRLFGQGLVDSPSDFGIRSSAPSHPQLLDYLAAYFIRSQWSTKAVIRHILTSQTYQQSSAARPDCEQIDPENRLLARMPRTRLDFEAHRDAILTVGGHLEKSIGGESVDITAIPSPPRRTVYARIDRQNLPGIFRTFDFASPDAHAPKRFETTVPQQALFQLNSPFIMEQASLVAERCLRSGRDINHTIETMFQNVLQRRPTEHEAVQARSFVSQSSSTDLPAGGWHYGYGSLNSDGTRVTDFKPLPAFHDGSWRGGPELPDRELGWCFLNSDGGHPGGNQDFSVIRRWFADADCVVMLSSDLQHNQQQGDGVRASIAVNDEVVSSEVAFNTQSRPQLSQVSLQRGEHLDFVVDCRTNEGHDSFTWKIRLAQVSGQSEVRRWNSSRDFSASQPRPMLSEWAQLAQILMLTNEFVYVD